MNREMKLLNEVRETLLNVTGVDIRGYSYKQLEKALTPPTADEVREAILTSPHIIAVKYYNKENDFVCYNDIGFCTSAKNMELRHFSKKALLYLARFEEGLKE